MPQPRTQNPTATAADFLTRSFAPGETIALLLRLEVPGGTLQRIVPLETVLAPGYLGWLAHENTAGANIYVAANPLRPGAKKRTKECIALVRHLYLDLDTEGEARLASLRASDTVPAPTAILSTSLGKYQVLWRVEGFTVEQQESALKLLALAFGADPACTDCNRVLRLPGFLNCKYDPPYPVTVEYPGDFTWHCDDFRLDLLAADAVLSRPVMPSPKHPLSTPISTRIPNTIGPGFCMNLPAERTPPSSRERSLPAVPISQIRCTTRSGLWMLHRPDSGSSKAFRSTTLSRCSKFAAVSRFRPRSARLAPGRLPRRRRG